MRFGTLCEAVSSPLSLTECPASSRISAKGPDHQTCHGPLRQRAPALLPGEASAGAQGQRRLCTLYRGKERYCPSSCWQWLLQCLVQASTAAWLFLCWTQEVRALTAHGEAQQADPELLEQKMKGWFICPGVCLAALEPQWQLHGLLGGTGTQEYRNTVQQRAHSAAPWAARASGCTQAQRCPCQPHRDCSLLSIRPMQGYCCGEGVQEETHKCLSE